jgi:endoglucanase
MISFRETLLHDILSQPTAPFREGHVISKISQELASASVPHFLDPIGNIVIGAKSKAEYLRLVRKKSSDPLRLFIAHLDHPGFHGMEWKSASKLQVKWHGGTPTQHLNGANVWLANSSGWVGHGKLQQAQLLPSGKAIHSGTVIFESETALRSSAQLRPASELYGGFSFRSPVWKEGELLYTKAADDLVGAFAITSLALDFWKQKKRPLEQPFLGLLTRAEEVGFIGAIGHFELGWLNTAKRKIICVSLETSRTLPGADIGKGPVVRLGDRFTVFNPDALKILSDIAQQTLPEKHQRRIMDGGTCEATAATVYGHPSIGISIPLGNYHNQSLEGGPDAAPPNGPAPEFVHYQDILGLLELCHALLKPKLPWNSSWKIKKNEFKKNLKEYRPLLQTGP